MTGAGPELAGTSADPAPGHPVIAEERTVTDTVTLTGVVATKPENVKTSTGLIVTNFRLASSQRRFDRAAGVWIDGDTNWYTVNAYRWLANNVANSLDKGQHIVVTGRLRVRNWTSGDRRGTSIEVDADALGHDLSFGVSQFLRLKPAAPADQAPGAGVEPVLEADPEGDSTVGNPAVSAASADAWAEPLEPPTFTDGLEPIESSTRGEEEKVPF
jgi:single-strand DNA-binding protein